MNWENLDVQQGLIFKNPNFPSLYELGSPARAAFKNSDYQSLGEWGKIWNNNRRKTFKNSNFIYMDALGKLCSNLS